MRVIFVSSLSSSVYHTFLFMQMANFRIFHSTNSIHLIELIAAITHKRSGARTQKMQIQFISTSRYLSRFIFLCHVPNIECLKIKIDLCVYGFELCQVAEQKKKKTTAEKIDAAQQKRAVIEP